ncbi:MAG TPA: DUF512 domain-containing protein [Pyrinomonadaceae bacterium]|nr:DUF512 domain-containing protein [Pyrinomonadaceae bacterium]
MYEFAVTPAVTSIRRRGAEITEVAPNGIGAELELEPGDRITKVNGRTIRDYLDFRFQAGGETELTIEVRKSSGEDWELQIERAEDEDFGFSFEQIVPRQCANECIFCFCKGNPSDARASLFVRDEDIRLSFLYGNYTTLTSITEDEMHRIIEQRLSPQYVSIHATDLEVRAHLLGVDKKRADISKNLARLLDAGIDIHAQVVLCPSINDGEVLRRTIDDLAAEYPRITSVAIVPLALTRYNTDDRLTPVTPEFCQQIIKQVSQLQKDLRSRLGTTFAFLGDEIYLRAGHPLPGKAHYGNYPQIEDGIGMVRTFNNDFEKLLKRLLKNIERGSISVARETRGTIFTGTMFAPILKMQIEKLNESAGTDLEVVGVENNYFGGDVAVAGLLTGGDFLAAAEQIQGDFVVIPQCTLKSDEDIFLDGMSLTNLREKLAMPVFPADIDSFASLLQQN